MTDNNNRWAAFASTGGSSKKKKKAVIYEKGFNNPAMYPDIAKARTVRTLADMTPEELAEIEERLKTDPKHARAVEQKRKLEEG